QTRAHAVGTPEPYVIRVDMRFFDHSSTLGVPGPYAVIQTCLDLRPPAAEPIHIATDAPFPIELNDSAKLSIRRIRQCIGLVQSAYRNCRSTELMAFIVLVISKLGFS